MREEKGVAVIKYKGFGYSLIVFDENIIYDKKAKLFPLGIGTYSYQWTIKVQEFDVIDE